MTLPASTRKIWKLRCNVSTYSRSVPPHIPSLFTFFVDFAASRTEIDVPARLRRAILQNDVLLVKRIIKNNPAFLVNPDFEDGSNTSLHLAAIKGHFDILVCLYHTKRVLDELLMINPYFGKEIIIVTRS